MEITVYSTPLCPWCKKAKEFLRRRQQKFIECDVSEENHCRDELLNKTNQLAVPVIEINGEILIGFNPEKLLELIAKYKDQKVVVEEES